MAYVYGAVTVRWRIDKDGWPWRFDEARDVPGSWTHEGSREEFEAAIDAAVLKRRRERERREIMVCSFCGGPRPCLRED